MMRRLQYWCAQISLYGPLALIGIRRWKPSAPGYELRSREWRGFRVYYRAGKGRA